MSDKNSVPVMVRMPPKMEANVRMLADYQGIETPELIRRGVQALIDCYLEQGDLPRRFKLVPMESEKPVLLVAEDGQSTYEHGPAKGGSPPGTRHVKPKRRRGAGPAAHLSKSA